MQEHRPFHHYVIKIASRCNINCSYCHIYNHEDVGWKRQPKFINISTFSKFCERVREHCVYHKKSSVNFVFHGGEPLLVGTDLLDKMAETVQNVLVKSNIQVSLNIQSNGLLFSESIGNCLRRNKILMGVSIDGPPEINDQHRLTHEGKGTSEALEEKLALITTQYSDIFSGFLTVVNPISDPISVIKYLLSYDPPGIDLLLPHHHYQNLPLGKKINMKDTIYADWLMAVFDYWYLSNTKTPIRYFDSIIRLLLGGQTLVETIGNPHVDVAVIESNGEVEIDDNLRSTADGMTRLGYNVFDNSLNQIAADSKYQIRRIGKEGLSTQCKSCYLVDTCGGGNLPHRFSYDNGFDNPSVYCADLEKLISHINKTINL